MNLLILGATGRTGALTVREAIKRGHHVTAVVRSKKKLAIPEVVCHEGSVTDVALMGKAAESIDAAICCLNIARSSDFPWAKLISPETLISDAIKTLIQVMEEKKTPRIITMSAWGAGDSWKQMNRLFRLLIKISNIRFGFDDHNRQEDRLMASSLAWTIVRPVFLNDKDSSAYQVVSSRPPRLGISRQAVGAFMMDCLEQNMFVHQTPVVCSEK